MKTQAQLDLVTTLLKHERGAARDDREAAPRVLDKMFAQLAPVVGDMGVIAVFVRSAVAAKTQCAALRSLALTIDSIDAVDAKIRDHFATLEDAEATECAIALCVEFVELMSRLIGSSLTAQLIQRAWPEVDLKESP